MFHIRSFDNLRLDRGLFEERGGGGGGGGGAFSVLDVEDCKGRGAAYSG